MEEICQNREQKNIKTQKCTGTDKRPTDRSRRMNIQIIKIIIILTFFNNRHSKSRKDNWGIGGS